MELSDATVLLCWHDLTCWIIDDLCPNIHQNLHYVRPPPDVQASKDTGAVRSASSSLLVTTSRRSIWQNHLASSLAQAMQCKLAGRFYEPETLHSTT